MTRVVRESDVYEKRSFIYLYVKILKYYYCRHVNLNLKISCREDQGKESPGNTTINVMRQRDDNYKGGFEGLGKVGVFRDPAGNTFLDRHKPRFTEH